MNGWRYHSLDDLYVHAQAERAPKALWAGSEMVVINEAHRVPGLFLAAKRAVDAKRQSGHYHVTSQYDTLLLRRG